MGNRIKLYGAGLPGSRTGAGHCPVISYYSEKCNGRGEKKLRVKSYAEKQTGHRVCKKRHAPQRTCLSLMIHADFA